MIKQFINLEWKQFFRSSNWQKSIAINVFMVFIAIYFMAMFLIMGVALYPVLNEVYPEQSPFISLNKFIFYWVIADLLMRFFFQKLPVMSVKPLLTLPIKRSKVVHYVLGKSGISFFNFLPLFAIIPFSVVLISKGHEVSTTLIWLATMILITLINNFLNFIIESLSAETELSFLPILLVAGALFALNYFEIVSLSEYLSNGILAISENPLYLIIPLLLLGLLYQYNYKILRKKLYIDNSLKSKTKEAKSTNLGWTKRFGEVAPFMQLDIRLMLRNKRPRSTLFILIIGLLYGLVFYPNPEFKEMEFIFVFIGIFVTGIFLISFGQFIPAWDGSYYKILMSQNIRYEKYLKSKFTLMVSSVALLFILSIPYVYFGWKILLVHFAAAMYNIGVNSHVILFGGSFNRKTVKLDQRAAFNYQGTGAVQWLLGIPLMLIPMAIFMVFYFLTNFMVGVAVITILGIIGIALHQRLMKMITKRYLDSKYKMIDAFSQDS